MDEIVLNVNWVAVIVGAIVSFLLGWLWYSPKLFGVKWAEGVGVSLDNGSAMPVGAMATQAIGMFLYAWVVGVTAKNEALLTIILIMLALVFLTAAGGKFSQKSTYAIVTESGFVVVMTIVMIIVQGIF